MGFFGGVKKDGENSDTDFFYGAGKSLLQRTSTSTDNSVRIIFFMVWLSCHFVELGLSFAFNNNTI